jgi:hypothetical protein
MSSLYSYFHAKTCKQNVYLGSLPEVNPFDLVGKFIPLSTCVDAVAHSLRQIFIRGNLLNEDSDLDKSLDCLFLGLSPPKMIEEIICLNLKTEECVDGCYIGIERRSLFSQVHLLGVDDHVQLILSRVVEMCGSRLRSRFFSKSGSIIKWCTEYEDGIGFHDVCILLFSLDVASASERRTVLSVLAANCCDVLIVLVDLPSRYYENSLHPQRISNLIQTFERGLQKKNLGVGQAVVANDVIDLFVRTTLAGDSCKKFNLHLSLPDWYSELQASGFIVENSSKIMDHWLGPVYLIHASSSKFRIKH